MSAADKGAAIGVAKGFFGVPALTGRPDTPYVGLFGDSRIYNCHYTDGGNAGTTYPAQEVPTARDEKTANGFACQLECKAGGRVELPRSLNFGISGQTTVSMVARSAANMQAMRAAGASAVIILAGTNDPGGSITVAQTNANLAQIEKDALNAGLIVIWIAEMPRGDSVNGSGLTGTALQDHMETYRFLCGRQNGKNVFVADAWPTTADLSSSSGWIKAGYSMDGLHPNAVGNQYVAAALLPIVQALWPLRSVLPATPSDIWSANHTTGAMGFNPMLTGTTGSLASGATGVVPDSFSQSTLPSGLTLACSQGTDTDGYPYWQATMSGTPAALAAMNLLNQSRTVGTQGLAIGGKVRAVAEVQFPAGMTGFNALDLYVGSGSLTCRTYASFSNVAKSAWPALADSGVWMSPTITIPTGATTVGFGLRAYFNGSAVSAAPKIKRFGLVPAV